MRGLQGDKWTEEQIQGFSKTKINQLDRLIQDLSAFKVLPEAFKPKARIYEAEAARRAFVALSKGNTAKAIEYLLALPTAIGKVNLYANELVVHLGFGHTHITRNDKLVPVPLVRGVGIQDPWAWEELFTAAKAKNIKISGNIKDENELKVAFMEQGYDLKLDNTGVVTCPGWSILNVEFSDPSDPRTYKSIKVGKHHACGTTFPASEPFHRIRCKSCKDALDASRGVGKRRKGLSKGAAESAIFSELLSLLD